MWISGYMYMYRCTYMYVELRLMHMSCTNVPDWMPEVLPGLSWQCSLWHLAGTPDGVADLALLSGPRLFLLLRVLSQQCHHTFQIPVDCKKCCMYSGKLMYM